jgi:uncharacterized protein involved in exopolysaccharide biosynthesis
VETARLNELSSQLTSMQALSSDSSSRRAQATSGAGDKLQEVLSNPLLSSLRADLSRAEARMQELNSRFGDNHPQVIEPEGLDRRDPLAHRHRDAARPRAACP